MHSCLVKFLRGFSDTNLSQHRFLVPVYSCMKLFLHDGIQDSKIQIRDFQSQEVIVTQGFVVEYVCMSETQ